MAWPLTGRALADFNRMLNAWKQYSTFPFIGPDDIDRLYNVLLAAGLKPQLEDVGNRPQYWLLQLVSQVGNSEGAPNGIDFSPDGVSANIGSFAFSDVGITSVVIQGETTPGIELIGQNSLLTVSAPELLSILPSGRIYLSNNISLASLQFPSLVSLDTGAQGSPITAESNAALTTVFLGNALISNGVEIYFDNNALSQSSVDYLLALAVASPGYVSGTFDLSGGTNSPPSSVAPGSDYDILVNRGVTVNVN